MSKTIQRSWFDQYMVPCFSPAPFIPVRAEGSRVWDQDGKGYIDFAGGIAVNVLGHANNELKEALSAQMENLWHIGNGYTNEPVLKLAQALVESTFADKVFFCNSGAEANEAALKIARKYALDKYGSHKNEIISFENSFHGRTLFTVTVGGQPKYSQDFAPLPQQITHLPYNDIETIKAHISEKTCAVIVEPIIGEGGIILADQAFLEALRELCDQHQALLIFDEIQTGIGRTGYLYAYEETGVEPDILTSAKGLGGGFPIGAMLVKQHIAEVFQPGSHGTTFGGNPLAAAVAHKVLSIVNQREFLAGVQARHHEFIRQMSTLNQRYPLFSEIRGKGLLLGAELEKKYQGKAKTLTNIAAEEGLIALIAGPDVLRFAPALNIEQQDINEGFARLENAFKRFVQE
ncbi:aspartate aminotransferase family protein [Xenorhabdus budapestensis]|uniref:Acetylornithine/succinyldiaminopimelate aminotransferase n=1 Tax=Xenorhabdus budapestensis TaxID=290110 RepID=A0A2D0J1Y2_XENBU|nr:aspartate aminotransferase family protein [Xenorhabdus budapestensis]PHM28122.1 4-aminobutyrate aminotransferase [Xenorhabdus budapestensis]QTL41177.1 aspartate aminotransferase family protein [Xenorhabdus budapestensis]